MHSGDRSMPLGWNRYYGAELGRFVSRDPIGYEAGELSLYGYCGNDPTNQMDPSGMAPPSGPMAPSPGPNDPFDPSNVPWNGAYGRNVLMPDGSVRFVVGDRGPIGQTVPNPVNPLDPAIADYYRRTGVAFSGPHVPSNAKAVGTKIDWDCFWQCMDNWSSAVLTSWIPNPFGHGVPASTVGAPAAVLTTPIPKPIGTAGKLGGGGTTSLLGKMGVHNIMKRPGAKLIGIGPARAIGGVATKAIPFAGWGTVLWDAGAAAYCGGTCMQKADDCSK